MWCDDPSIVKKKIKEFFHSKFKEDKEMQVLLDGVTFNQYHKGKGNKL